MKKVLMVYGGWDGHAPKETSHYFADILRSRGYEVELSDTLDIFKDVATLKTYDLIVPNWTMGTIDKEQNDGLTGAVAAGTGLAGWHGGMGDAFRSCSNYQFMVGGQFVEHPDNEVDYVVNIVKKSDPIMAGLSDFKVRSEQYYMHVDPSNEVLATTTFHTKTAPWVNGTVIPAVWKRRWGAGKVFYSSLGHTLAVLQIPEVTELQTRGLEWACRS